MVSYSLTRKAFLAGAAALVALSAVPALAASDPAASTIETLDAHTLAIMKEAKGLGFHGRYTRLKPVIEQALDLLGDDPLRRGADLVDHDPRCRAPGC